MFCQSEVPHGTSEMAPYNDKLVFSCGTSYESPLGLLTFAW